ncbi:hypothetical protein [Parvularcula lutaonensis]|uniref:Uncharacterized protein n=1 Tax=Parvularcula lutaonensis TaxID=491923 RepID=A0ABV7MCQ3_9PROT|nr:hypothetical protein [Parvularcula lutaonensis]GGY51409.1 hypothetical protein GCM10007148_20360 [Parvularcula lutaonensis]
MVSAMVSLEFVKTGYVKAGCDSFKRLKRAMVMPDGALPPLPMARVAAIGSREWGDPGNCYPQGALVRRSVKCSRLLFLRQSAL